MMLDNGQSFTMPRKRRQPSQQLSIRARAREFVVWGLAKKGYPVEEIATAARCKPYEVRRIAQSRGWPLERPDDDEPQEVSF